MNRKPDNDGVFVDQIDNRAIGHDILDFCVRELVNYRCF